MIRKTQSGTKNDYTRIIKSNVTIQQEPIDEYIADFYCHELKLVIEIDGEYHLAESAKEYDEHRTNVLNTYGIEVIRYTNEEILNHFDYVEKNLREKVKDRNKALGINKY